MTTKRIGEKAEAVLSGQGWCNCQKCPDYNPETDNCPYEPWSIVSKFSAENEEQAWETVEKYWPGFTKRFIEEMTEEESNRPNRFGL